MIGFIVILIITLIVWCGLGFCAYLDTEGYDFSKYKTATEKFNIFWSGPAVWLCVLVYVACEKLSEKE